MNESGWKMSVELAVSVAEEVGAVAATGNTIFNVRSVFLSAQRIWDGK